MGITLNAYINFKDNTRQAMQFYHSIFGGELTMNTFADFHSSKDPSEDNMIMHSELKAENDIYFMASDTPDRMEYRPGTNFSMSFSGDNEPVLRTYFEKLSEGGTIVEPLTKAPWGDTFGMCTDKFGVAWLVNISGGHS